MIINPGTGPVLDATVEHAAANMARLVEDAGAITHERAPELDNNGRFGFRVLRDNGTVADVEMPGWPLERVRYTGENGQNIRDFPRLYVDGSSWVWKYAVSDLRIPGETP